jgi:hypothetical protein
LNIVSVHKIRKILTDNGCVAPRAHIGMMFTSNKIVSNCVHTGVDDVEQRWFGRPKAKHNKIRPRWLGMEDGQNGKVKTRKASPFELAMNWGETKTNNEHGSTILMWGYKEPTSII